MLRTPITLGTFYTGLSSLGKLEQNKWQTLTNCDVHSEVGMVMPQLAMTIESSVPTELCVESIDPSGNVYCCSTTSGKIWKRTTAGVYTLLHTNTNGAHRGSRYFNGYLWYWTATKLGYFDLVSTYSDSFATGTNFTEGIEANNTLMIGNGRYIGRVDAANAFSNSEFVVPAQFYITCLKNIGDDVLVGTKISNDVAYCKVFLWDTVSTAWTYEDEVFEIGVNCFMQLDNFYIAQCGVEGRFYYWTGGQMSFFEKISGITTQSGYQMATTYNGRPLFANGNKIYSIHRASPALPFAIVCEYTTTGTITSIFVQGQNLLASTTSGIEKRGTAYATAIIETPEIQSQISDIKIRYDIYAEGVGIETNINGVGYVTQSPVFNSLTRDVYFNGGLVDGFTTSVKVTLTPSGANIPKIKAIILQ